MNNFNNVDMNFSINSAEALSNYEKAMADKNAKEKEYKSRNLAAVEKTASNTKEANERLNRIIDNQNNYIKLLEEQLSLSRVQLDVLNNIFASNEDEYACEREIAELIRQQIDDKHPLWDYINGITQNILSEEIIKNAPVLYKTLIKYLQVKGIKKF